MKTRFTLLFVLSFCFVQAQSTSFDHIVYKQEVNPAYILAIKEAKYTESLEKLEAVSKKYGFLYGEDYRLQSFCYKKMRNDSLAALSLKRSWSVPSFDMRTLWYIAALNPGKLMEGFNEYQNKLIEEGFENGAKLRPKNADSLLAVINKMSEGDHLVRDHYYPNRQNTVFKAEFDSMNARNERQLEDMVRKIGFPGEKKLQLMEYSIWFVLVHSSENEAFYERMSPFFLNEVKIGNMSPWMFANWVDLHQSGNRLPTIYNSMVEFEKELTPNELEQISKNRFEIGLVDLEFSHPEF